MIAELVEYFISGGWVVWPMMVLCLAMWFAIGFRYSELSPLKDLKAREIFENRQTYHAKNMLGKVVTEFNQISNKYPGEMDELMDEVSIEMEAKASQYSSMLNSIVTVSPLLGLLGTVIGMIETFDALAEMTLFASGGGIAGGISQALITTQLGLIIAIPGLLVSRIIKKWENKFLEDLHQLKTLYRMAYSQERA